MPAKEDQNTPVRLQKSDMKADGTGLHLELLCWIKACWSVVLVLISEVPPSMKTASYLKKWAYATVFFASPLCLVVHDPPAVALHLPVHSSLTLHRNSKHVHKLLPHFQTNQKTLSFTHKCNPALCYPGFIQVDQVYT